MPIRILVVDEQSIYRAGLCELIAAEMPDVEARGVSKLTQIVSCGHCNTMFDLVLVGAGVSNSAALDTLKTAREARVAIRFAIVSAADTRADILAGLAAGLHGYICKKQSDVEILEARAYFGLGESGGFSREFGWASLWRSIRYFGDDRCRSLILWTCVSGW